MRGFKRKAYDKSGLEILQLRRECRTPCTLYSFIEMNAHLHLKIIPKITSPCTIKNNEDTAFQN